MATSLAQISDWFDMGVAGTGLASDLGLPLSHMLVVCDTWDWSDFPIFVTLSQSVDQIVEYFSGREYKVMEIYDLARDRDEQLAEVRAKNVGVE